MSDAIFKKSEDKGKFRLWDFFLAIFLSAITIFITNLLTIWLLIFASVVFPVVENLFSAVGFITILFSIFIAIKYQERRPGVFYGIIFTFILYVPFFRYLVGI